MGDVVLKENKKIEKKRKELKNLRKRRKRENRKKRIERKRKLVKLGTLFRILDLLDEKQETMLGFLEKYSMLSELEKEKLTEIGAEILSTNKLKKYDDDLNNRKRMFFLMIRKSALLEKLKIHLENPNTILGYLSKYKNISESEKIKFSTRGTELFSPIEKKIEEKNNEKTTDKDKLKILIFLQEKGIDSTRYLKEKYNITIHNLNKKQMEEILIII